MKRWLWFLFLACFHLGMEGYMQLCRICKASNPRRRVLSIRNGVSRTMQKSGSSCSTFRNFKSNIWCEQLCRRFLDVIWKIDGLTVTENETIDGQGSKVWKYNDGGGSLPVVSNYSIRIFIALLEINLCKIYMMNKTKNGTHSGQT